MYVGVPIICARPTATTWQAAKNNKTNSNSNKGNNQKLRARLTTTTRTAATPATATTTATYRRQLPTTKCKGNFITFALLWISISLFEPQNTHTHTHQYIAHTHTHTRGGKVCAPIRPGQLVEHFVRVVRPKGTTFFFPTLKTNFFPPCVCECKCVCLWQILCHFASGLKKVLWTRKRMDGKGLYWNGIFNW